MADTRLINIADIKANTGQIPGVKANPRTIRGDKYDKLKKSLADNPEMLELRELLVYEHEGKYVCIGGNMRYRACKELGYKDVPCKVIPPAATPEQLNAYIIKDNSGFGEWDWDMLANEWEADLLDDWGIDFPHDDGVPLEEEEDAKEDEFDEEDEVETRCKKGEIWQCGSHRLMCGDSTSTEDVGKLMGGAFADLLVTDPPYNVDYSSKNKYLNAADGGNRIEKAISNDKMNNAQFLEFLTNANKAADSVMRKGAAFYIWHRDAERLSFENSIYKIGWLLKQTLVWVKNNHVLGRMDYQGKHEPCLYGWKDGAAHYFVPFRDKATVHEDKIDVKKLSKAELQDLVKELLSDDTPTTVIHEDKPLRNGDHPTMKPVKLIGRLIKNSSKPGERVLDLFGGSGTTMIACEQLGRKCYMMELDPHYCDVILARWEKLTGKDANKLS